MLYQLHESDSPGKGGIPAMSGIDIRSLDMSMLRTFEALLAERSVSRAASRLFLSQPAVSASLKRLREVFGDPLFRRTASGVEPTARALALAPHVESVLSELNRLLCAGLEFDPASSTRMFRIVGSDTLSLRVLPQLCEELTRCGSRVRVVWDLANYRAYERLQRGDGDLGLLPSFTPPLALDAELLYEDHYVVATAPGSVSGGLTIDDFCKSPQVFIGYGRSAVEDAVDGIMAKAGVHRYPQVAVTTFLQMALLVGEGGHVAILPARVAAQLSRLIEAHPLPFSLPRYGLFMCHSHHASADPGLQWLKTVVSRIARSPAAPSSVPTSR